jgi:mono/diheme cytochrome c family protein
MRRIGPASTRRVGALAGAVAASVGLVAVLSACGTPAAKDRVDLVNGKRLFVQKCGACHILDRAGTRGTTGPDLDQAFVRAVQDGMGRDSIRGIVKDQVLYPLVNGRMPAKLVKGDDLGDVAAYVSMAAAKPGKDEGLLAQAVGGKQKPLAKARNGQVTNPADPNGQLLYVFKNMEAPPGPLTIRTPNESAVPHNIAVVGNGVNEVGPVVQGGGVSQIRLTVKVGKYPFLCTVPGHAQAGMKGTLTVK